MVEILKTDFEQDAQRYVPVDKNGCCFTVLADYSRYAVELLDKNKENEEDPIK